jgi:G:T/U-mismatch repair DNA glycosylase
MALSFKPKNKYSHSYNKKYSLKKQCESDVKSQKYLIIGTFNQPNEGKNDIKYFYGSSRNKFWEILFNVYKNKEEKTLDNILKLQKSKKIIFSDTIDVCVKVDEDKSFIDSNILPLKLNSELKQFVRDNKNIKIVFTSKNARNYFLLIMGEDILKLKNEMHLLPSPSNMVNRNLRNSFYNDFIKMSKNESHLEYKIKYYNSVFN